MRRWPAALQGWSGNCGSAACITTLAGMVAASSSGKDGQCSLCQISACAARAQARRPRCGPHGGPAEAADTRVDSPRTNHTRQRHHRPSSLRRHGVMGLPAHAGTAGGCGQIQSDGAPAALAHCGRGVRPVVRVWTRPGWRGGRGNSRASNEHGNTSFLKCDNQRQAGAGTVPAGAALPP